MSARRLETAMPHARRAAAALIVLLALSAHAWSQRNVNFRQNPCADRSRQRGDTNFMESQGYQVNPNGGWLRYPQGAGEPVAVPEEQAWPVVCLGRLTPLVDELKRRFRIGGPLMSSDYEDYTLARGYIPRTATQVIADLDRALYDALIARIEREPLSPDEDRMASSLPGPLAAQFRSRKAQIEQQRQAATAREQQAQTARAAQRGDVQGRPAENPADQAARVCTTHCRAWPDCNGTCNNGPDQCQAGDFGAGSACRRTFVYLSNTPSCSCTAFARRR